jgi:Putative phage metallopeptidase
MAIRTYKKDDTGELEKIANALIHEEDSPFELLKGLRILYAWCDPPEEESKSGRTLDGSVRKLNGRERDFFGYDVAIVMSDLLWANKSDVQKQKLVWHELNHLQVDEDDTTESGLAIDKAGRVVIRLRPHDLNMDRFAGELKKFGASEEERGWIDTVASFAGLITTTLPSVGVPATSSTVKVDPDTFHSTPTAGDPNTAGPASVEEASA